MDTLTALAAGFAVALTPVNLLWALAGVTLGTAVGVLPGIGPALTVALLLPVTYSLEPVAAFIMFAGIYYGGMYGGSTTSILLNTPGESASVMSAVEGHLMARAGRGGAALATAARRHRNRSAHGCPTARVRHSAAPRWHRRRRRRHRALRRRRGLVRRLPSE
jgi:putative tricarboxylic transport membrane protein